MGRWAEASALYGLLQCMEETVIICTHILYVSILKNAGFKVKMKAEEHTDVSEIKENGLSSCVGKREKGSIELIVMQTKCALLLFSNG